MRGRGKSSHLLSHASEAGLGIGLVTLSGGGRRVKAAGEVLGSAMNRWEMLEDRERFSFAILQRVSVPRSHHQSIICKRVELP